MLMRLSMYASSSHFFFVLKYHRSKRFSDVETVQCRRLFAISVQAANSGTRSRSKPNSYILATYFLVKMAISKSGF